VPPIISTTQYYLINVCRQENFLLAIATGETSPLVTIEFLHRVLDIFDEYFGDIEESTIKDNFSTVYQLLEEMMDYGYPLTTEPNVLKAMIQPPTVLSRIQSAATGRSTISDILPDGTISNMPWRQTGVKYSQNEIYLDIVEEIDATVDRSGTIVSSEVSGAILANSRLSGMPDLTLQFTDPEVIDDCSFHPCVRYNRYDRDKVVSFVPPDGQFELMRYRVNTKSPVVAPVYCQPQVSFEYGAGKGQISVMVGQRAGSSSLIFPSKKGSMVVEEVEVVIPFSKAVRTANLTVTAGTCLFDEATKVVKWTVGKLMRETSPQLTGTILLQTGQSSRNTQETDTPPIQMHWKVPMASVSGLAVAGLQLTNERYKPYKGVRTITKSGKFQIRSS